MKVEKQRATGVAGLERSAETRSRRTPTLYAHPKHSREQVTLQDLTLNEKRVFCYLRSLSGRKETEIVAGIRTFARDLLIPRVYIKKALEGLAGKKRIKLRTVHQEDGSTKLGITVITRRNHENQKGN